MINDDKVFNSLPGNEQSKSSQKVRRVRRVLGIDPGLANTGFGVVDFCEGRYRMVSYGCITTKADQPHGERLLTIYSRLCAVIDEFQPDEAGMETLYFARNVTSAMGVADFHEIEGQFIERLCSWTNILEVYILV